jgi:hypothetical protein
MQNDEIEKEKLIKKIYEKKKSNFQKKHLTKNTEVK